MIKILIADDHTIFRKGLRQTIDDSPHMRVVDEAVNGNEVLSKAANSHYDIIMLDISMPGPNIFDIIARLKSDDPKRGILVLTMHPEDQYAIRILKAGASGYLTKETDEEILIKAIRKVYNGGKYVSPSLAEKLAFALDVDFEKPLHESLSDREFQVMRMIAGGQKISEIANEIHLGVSTVSTYRSRILEKTGLKNNAEIIQYAYKNNLID
jgi:two-component system, NarL family, invasion response regulator UvrY